MSLTFEAVALQISNPTYSDIVYRQGGTDFPSANSADFVIPAQTIMRVPAVGNQFAFAFIDTTQLVKGSIQIARITALDKNEASIQLGSVQAVSKPMPYEVSRHPSLGAGFVTNVPAFNGFPLTPVGSDNVDTQTIGTTYTVANGRIALLASVNLSLIRTAVATARSGLPRVTLTYNPPGLGVVIAAQLPLATNVVNDVATINAYPTDYFLLPGGSVTLGWACADTGGSFVLYGTFSIFEFDV